MSVFSQGADTASSLVKLNTLRKICCAPSLLQTPATQPGAAPRTLVQSFSCAEAGKLDVLVRLLRRTRSTTNDRFVLISNFTSVLDIFERMLRSDLKQSFVRLDGSQAAKKRQVGCVTQGRMASDECPHRALERVYK